MQAPRTRSAGRRAVSLVLITGSALGPTAPIARAAASVPRGGNLISNPGFERGGKEIDDWGQTVPMSVATVKPRFRVSDVEPLEGKRSASVRADYRGGLTAYTQELRVPPRAKSIHFEAQARLDRIAHEGGAMLRLSFVGPDLPGGRVESESRRLSGVADWTLLSIDARIPEGTTSIEVRCGVVGPAVASFDDVLATSSTEDALQLVFAAVYSDYVVRLPANETARMFEPFVRVPLPLVSGAQRPVAFRINTRPEDKVASLGLFRHGVNRMLEIRFEPMFPGDEIKLRLDTLVMIDAVERIPDGIVRLPRPAQIKEGEAIFLESAPGIDPVHPAIVEALREIKGNDLPDVLEKIHRWRAGKVALRPLAREREMADEVPSESVGACLAAGQAGPVGLANTLVSMLRGLGLPARLMIGTSRGGTIDEYYYVDVWTPSLGWTRMDPLTGRWPVPSTEAVIHCLVDPLDARPDGYTPYDPKVSAAGLVLEARPDRMDRARLYRPAAPITLTQEGLSILTGLVDVSYSDLVGDPLSNDQWLPIQGVGRARPEIPGASRAHLEVQRWLDSPRLVGQ